MVIFNSYVKLPEGKPSIFSPPICRGTCCRPPAVAAQWSARPASRYPGPPGGRALVPWWVENIWKTHSKYREYLENTEIEWNIYSNLRYPRHPRYPKIAGSWVFLHLLKILLYGKSVWPIPNPRKIYANILNTLWEAQGKHDNFSWQKKLRLGRFSSGIVSGGQPGSRIMVVPGAISDSWCHGWILGTLW